ncbi:MAG: guanylate kinase [Bacteroidales bacterium]|nr:guanylate kinase [Bacteroidales bacterium]
MNLIVSAPSGSGKTTILSKIFEMFPDVFGFSVSATTRQPRKGEMHGKDYYFISVEEFNRNIEQDAFLEFEQVYEGLFYGTLKSEIERINSSGKRAVFDVDVKGGINIKQSLGNQAYSVFIMPPDLLTLERRLKQRNTETEDSLNKRLMRAEMEISYADKFDQIIINGDLDVAVSEFADIVRKHIL